MEPTLRSIQVLKQEAEDVGLHVTRKQTLDREERAAWRDTQKRQVEFQMAELQAKTAEELQSEREKKADEIHTTERADEIKIQIAQRTKEPLHPLIIKMPSHPKLPSFIDEKDELGSYLLRLECQLGERHVGYKVEALLTGRQWTSILGCQIQMPMTMTS